MIKPTPGATGHRCGEGKPGCDDRHVLFKFRAATRQILNDLFGRPHKPM